MLQVLCGLQKGAIHLLDIASGENIKSFKGHTKEIDCIQVLDGN